MWIILAAMCHTLRDKTYLQTSKYYHNDYLVFPHYMPFTQMLSQLYIYFDKNCVQHVSNTTTIRVFQKFHYNYHGDCRILANGMHEYAIWNATITSLQFWAEDLDLITLGIASECMSTPPSSGHPPATHYMSTI